MALQKEFESPTFRSIGAFTAWNIIRIGIPSGVTQAIMAMGGMVVHVVVYKIGKWKKKMYNAEYS